MTQFPPMHKFCAFEEEFLSMRKAKKKKIKKKEKEEMMKQELNELTRFLFFLKEEKGLESLDESFFDEQTNIEIVEDYFESVSESKLSVAR